MIAIVKAKKAKTSSYSSDTSAMIKGIVINRDPPKGSGWCGNENCSHVSHKRFNES
ncbi:MAG TPA: hypothetical protein VH234_06155 [Candidatus Saccharimonadales bacterium]|jgi:hypothetical protein|nr:hypothetical protein [Candidatus Saccharimonadales bacterium]